MSTEVRLHRTLTVLLAVALLATLSVALTGGHRADAVEGPVDVVYVTTGRNFPDALAGGTLAATTGAPMLTVEPQLPIPPATVTALESLDPDRIVIFGGPVAVSDAVKDALGDHARSGSVTRIEGGDRHDTAAQIADALPNKVHDADRLDGLDSTDFLTADDPLDADTVDGRPAADLRVLNIGNWSYVNGAVDLTGLIGPLLDPDTDSGIGSTFIVPPGHAVGDPLYVDVLLQEDTFAACSLRLLTQGTASVPGDTGSTFVDFNPVGTSDVAYTFDAPSGVDNHLLTLELEQTDNVEPGTAFTFVIRRDADNGADSCDTDLSIAGAQLRY